jgi:cystathionine beta-lyase family protein involved in aluminum resistance
MVGEALKGGRLAAEVLAREGHALVPPPGRCAPWSFITAVELGSAARMAAFCTAVQQVRASSCVSHHDVSAPRRKRGARRRGADTPKGGNTRLFRSAP